jgi:DNA-binding transcriptional LysR family regulator
LFYRHGRGTALTETGQELYDASRNVLQQLDDIKTKIMGLSKRVTGLVQIGVPQSIAATIGASLAKQFHKKCPDARLHILEAFTGHLREWIEAGTIDLAILNDCRRAQNMRVTPILMQDLFLIGPPARGGGPKSVTIEDVAAFPLVLPGQDHGLRRVVDTAFQQAKIPVPPIIAEIDSMEALRQFVESGPTRTILPYGSVYRDVAEGRLTASLIAYPPMRSKLVMATPFNKPFTKATRQLIDFVRQEFARSVEAGILRGKTFGLK